MRYPVTFACALALAASPVLAESHDSKSMMERGAELFFEGLRQELEPTLDDLRGMAEQFGPSMRSFIEEMGPAFMEMVDEVKDWTDYHPPEMLANGDIILRKKQHSDDAQDPKADPETETEKTEDPESTDL